jgi:hypothetical protein
MLAPLAMDQEFTLSQKKHVDVDGESCQVRWIVKASSSGAHKL